MRPEPNARCFSAICLTIFVALVALALAPVRSALAATDYWHTSGNQIVNSANQPVRIAGVNWYGFETTDYVVHGLWTKDYKTILNTIHSLGYNVVRIPFSNEMVESSPVPGNISYYNSVPINTDLQGLNSLQIMDKIVAYAGQIGLRIILDNHRSEAGNSAEDNGLWYTGTYPESAWINDWVNLAKRYSGNSTVIGFDLRNEPHNGNGGAATWGTGDPASDWRLAAQMVGNQVLAVNPHLLIFVEGIQAYGNDWYWWGGNLEGAAQYPVALNVANQLVYSAHDYGPNLSAQPWFNGSASYASLAAVWTKYWAYLAINKIAPVWVGEFGTDNSAADLQSAVAGSQGQWFQSIIQFLHGNPAINWTYWALNGEDSYGLLDSGYDPTPPSALKQQMLASIQAAGVVGPTPTPTATVKATPTATAKATPSPTATITATPLPTPDFTMSVTPPSVSVYAGSAASYTVTAAARNGFAGTIALSISGLPAGAGASFSPASIAASGSSVLKVSTGASTPIGVNTLTVKGVSGTISHTGTVGLTVTRLAGAAKCTVEYDVTSDWGAGMVANVYITNLTGVAANGWTLSWNFAGNQQIVNLWNGTVAQSGKAVTVRNESWNGSVTNGATVMFGFQAAYTGANTAPNKFVFNGLACSMK